LRPAPFFVGFQIRTNGLRTPLLMSTLPPAPAWSISAAGTCRQLRVADRGTHAVRRDAGMFDVSHMCVVDLRGARVRDYCSGCSRTTWPAHAAGKALYSCMLREHGGVIDDLIVYYLDDRWYRMVVNAGTATRTSSGCGRRRRLRCVGRAAPRPRMIAVQGPRARSAPPRCSIRASQRARSSSAISSRRARAVVRRAHRYTARTAGIMLPPSGHRDLGSPARGRRPAVRARRARYAAPRGGMNLYWQRHGTNPRRRSSRPGWTILEPQEATSSAVRGSRRRRRRACRASWWSAAGGPGGAAVTPEGDRAGGGEARSQRTFSPTLERSIGSHAFPPIPATTARSRSRRLLHATVVRPPFVRHGKIAVAL